MNRLTALLFIALLTFILVLLITNPDLFNDIYLYLIGLAGVIIKALQGVANSIKKAIKGDDEEVKTESKPAKQPANKSTSKTTLNQQQADFYQSDAVG